jgi:branched-chain amino acid transport system substrate-binding protein
MVGSAIGAALAGLVLAVTVGGAFAHSTGATPLPAATCSAVQNSSGQYLVASDLPLLGPELAQTSQMTKAIAFEFAKAGWKAGKYTIAYQSCNDATVQAKTWDSGTGSTNATSYAQDASVLGVIGTFNSGCAEIEVPILNRASGGSVAMVSPANTYVGLTHVGPGTAAGEPGKYYPTGTRNYARVVAADDYQGAADATLAQQLGVKKLYILNDKQAYGAGVAKDLQNAAGKLGIDVIANQAWDPNATSYAALALKIKASGAQAVFLGGLICENGGKLIKDIRVNAPNLTILAPDGFTPISSDVSGSNGEANGMYVSVAGLPTSKLPPAGQSFVKAFDKTIGGKLVQPYSVYAAQAADVILAAIAASNGTRSSVTSELFKVNIKNGILGPIAFNKNGDVSSDPVAIYKIVNGQQTTDKVIVPATKLVAAA